MKTLLSQLIKNKTIKHRKRICLDQEFNKAVARQRLHQRIGIIAFMAICFFGIIAILIVAFGSIFGIAS